MVTVKKNPKVRLFPLYNEQYFIENKEKWFALKRGEDVEIPNDVFDKLAVHFVKVKKQVKKIKHETFKDGEE